MPTSSAKPKKKPVKKTKAKAKPKASTKAKPKTAKRKTAVKKATKKKTTAKKAPVKKAPAKKKTVKKKKSSWTSRAILRSIEAGASADCPFCEEQVSFKARDRKQQVICNIYENNVWQRVEQYHAECYKKAKNPYGKPKQK